jgi:hypothetical protein
MGTTSAINGSLLSVNGSTSITSNLSVGNNANFLNAYVSSNLTVSNDFNVVGKTTTTGDVIAGSNLYVYENIDVFGTANMRNRLTVNGGVVVKRKSNPIPNNSNSEITLSSDLRILEDGIIQGTLDVLSDVTFSNAFLVLGNASFRSNVNVSSDVVVDGNTTIHSALIVNSNAIIGKDTILVGNLTTLSNVTLGSSTSYNDVTINGRTRINSSSQSNALIVNQSGTGNLLTLQKSGTDKIVASSNGYLGIGTSNPTKPLEVVGDINVIGNIYQNNSLLQQRPIILSSTRIKEDSKNYRSILSWTNNSMSINNLYVKSFLTSKQGDNTNSSNFSYNLRVYDSTTNTTLHSSRHQNQTPSNLLLTLSNVTSNSLVNIELHSKVGPIGNYVCVESVLLN